MRTMNERILIVEDEPSVREVLERYLVREGYDVVTCPDGASALRHVEESAPDLVVLDIMLPGVDGIQVCREIRRTSAVPVIMLTARGEAEDRILGFGVGADDYVTKPFIPLEVVLRVQAVLRRAQKPASALMDAKAANTPKSLLRYGDLVIDRDARRVMKAGRLIELTVKEFELLWTLAEHAGHVLSRSQLVARVWEYEDVGDTSTVTVHIRKLREKVEEDPSNPTRIRTVWGLGYRFEKGETP